MSYVLKQLNMRTIDRLGQRENRGKRKVDNTEKTSGRCNDVEGEGKRADSIERL